MDSDRRLSSKMTISLASLATSVPDPMANPTSAFLSAGASLTPSPVIPTTRFRDWASLTRRLLSWGSERAIILRFGKIFLTSASVFLCNSSLVIIKSSLFFNKPISLPIFLAVSMLSPVSIIVLIWAFSISSRPSIASFLISSLMKASPIKERRLGFS